MRDELSRLTPSEREGATRLLARAPYAFVAVVDPTGPYVVPMNFAYAPGRLYLHTGPGRKSAALAADPRVCAAIIAEAAFCQGPTPCEDGFAYQSIIVEGSAELVEERDERETALRAIIAKYDPAAVDRPLQDAVFANTLVYVVHIEAVTYKGRPRNGAV